jgi:hypothetical protein
MMVDSPTEQGVRTSYIGTLTLAGRGASSARAVKTSAEASAAPRRPGCG